VTEIHWEPTVEQPPARYAPPYATGFVPIPRAQFARFRRGDSTLTLAAFDLTPAHGVSRGQVDVRLAVARDPATSAVIGRVLSGGRLRVAAVLSAWRPTVVSLEALGVKTGLVARRRAMVAPDPAGLPPVLSDILLFAPNPVMPKSLDEAGATALRPAAVPVGQRVGLYWEVYSAPNPSDTTEVAVTVTKARSQRDALYPMGRPDCPPRVASPVTVQWQEEPGAAARGAARSIALDLRSLSRGRYVVAIQMSAAGRPRGCSSRELQIVAR
jgi:hypothetical protein